MKVIGEAQPTIAEPLQRVYNSYEDFADFFVYKYNRWRRGTYINTILVCGNGGSASQANHFVGELVGRFNGVDYPIPAISLNANDCVVTALGNDYGFDQTFNRQVMAYGNPRGMLLGLSTSGNSLNVLNAIRTANDIYIHSFSIVGNEDSPIAEESYCTLVIPGTTQEVQEETIKVLHMIAGKIKELVR